MQRLKLLVYAEKQLGLPIGESYVEAPSCLLQIDNRFFEKATNAIDADFIIFPYDLRSISRHHENDLEFVQRILFQLPYFQQFQQKHVLFFNADNWLNTGFQGPFFRTSVDKTKLDRNTIVMPPFGAIEDFGNRFSEGNVIYQTSFVGAVGTWDKRVDIVNALMRNVAVHYYVSVTHRSFGWEGDDAAKPRMRAAYVDVLSQSITILAPRGAGMFSMRFYEALSMGRIPILIGDNCALPCEDEIQYDNFIIRVPECDIDRIGFILRDWFHTHGEDAVIEKCVMARRIFEQYFRNDRLDDFVVKSLWKVKDRQYSLNY